MYSHHDLATTSIPGFQNRFYEERAIEPVNQIHVSGAVNVLFKPSAQPRLAIAGELAEGIKSVKTRIVNNTLLIERDVGQCATSAGAGAYHYQVHQSGVRVQVMTDVRFNVSVSAGAGAGAANIHISGAADTANLREGRVIAAVSLPQAPAIRHMGEGKVILNEVQQESLALALCGVGTIEAQGHATELRAIVQGHGRINTRALVAQQTDLQIQGMGMIEAHAEKEARSTITGMGTIIVHGNPAIRTEYIASQGHVTYSGA
jgi:hypothetical protein